jgi:hypothetical protein
MARAEHVDVQFPTWTERNLQPPSEPRERMELKPASLADEIPVYTQLQRQIHHALREQHPEWVQPNGDSPICDSYESRLAELLRTLTWENRDKNCGKNRNFCGASLGLLTENFRQRTCHPSMSQLHQI